MRKLLWIGLGVAVTVVVVQQVARSSFGIRFRESMAHHEEALRAALLPDEETLARARETRAGYRGRGAAEGPEPVSDAEMFPDDGTDYF